MMRQQTTEKESAPGPSSRGQRPCASAVLQSGWMVVALPLMLMGCASSAGGPTAQSAASSDSAASSGSADQSAGRPAAATSLPDFQLEALGGGVERLSDHLGKEVVLIDFWATFCDPCLVSMPHLNDLYLKYRDQGFVILGVSIDGPQSVARVRSEVRKLGIEFPILLDPDTEALSLYNPKTSAPYSVLIDKQGNIIKRKEGFTPTDVPALEQAIAGAL